MTPEEIIKQIFSETENAVNNFQKAIPGIQDKLLEKITLSLKDLQLTDGKILNNVRNLKLINDLKNNIERIIITKQYSSDVKDFVSTYDNIAALQISYFSSYNNKFTPNKTLPIIKDAAVDLTLNGLLKSGIQANVVDSIGQILVRNSTTGGSYAALTEMLRTEIKGNSEVDGSLLKYAKTYTVDAINGFSRQYHQSIAQDLKFNWGRYIGSNITTTREFCEWMTKKEWFHRSELPEIIKGNIDGHQCKLSKYGLPLGMKKETNVNNFETLAGGWQCAHHVYWVPDSAVPKIIKDRLGIIQVEPVVQGAAPEVTAADLKTLFNKDTKLGYYKTLPGVTDRIANVHKELAVEEKMVIAGYTQTEYVSLNKYLRGETGKKDKYNAAYTKLLNKSLDKIDSKHEGWVYRGTDMPAVEIKKYSDALANNKPIEHPYFTSTFHKVGSEFTGSTKMQILSKSGKNIEKLSNHKEDEVLFKAGTNFKVISVTQKKGVTFIKLEEI